MPLVVPTTVAASDTTLVGINPGEIFEIRNITNSHAPTNATIRHLKGRIAFNELRSTSCIQRVTFNELYSTII